jgi:hypothetical protein
VRQRDVPNPVDVTYDGGPALVGYEIGATGTLTGAAGAVLPVTLYWQAAQQANGNPQIFVHVLDASGNLVAQSDGAAYGGLYPVVDWLPGEIVRDERTIPLPHANAAATLLVGLYDLDNLQRLPARAGAGVVVQDQAVMLPVTP